MAEIKFSLADLFEQVWGAGAFTPSFPPVHGNSVDDLSRKEFGITGSSDYYLDDANGREYFLPITITYADSNGENKDIILSYPVLSVTCRKTIIRTPLTERRGTVKEFINCEDYVIKIKGVMIAGTNEFPEDDVVTLRALYEQNVPVSIKNPITDIFLLRPDRSGSDQVVITRMDLPEVTGIKNVRPYEIELESDEGFNLVDIS